MMNTWVREEATRQMARWNISDYPSGNPTWYRPMFESCLRAGLLRAERIAREAAIPTSVLAAIDPSGNARDMAKAIADCVLALAGEELSHE